MLLANSLGLLIADFKYNSRKGEIWEWVLFGYINILVCLEQVDGGPVEAEKNGWLQNKTQSNSLYGLQQSQKEEKALNPIVSFIFK